MRKQFLLIITFISCSCISLKKNPSFERQLSNVASTSRKNSNKACPTTGSRFLSDEFFEEIYMFSDRDYGAPLTKVSNLKKIVSFLLTESGEEPPKIVLAVSELNFKAITTAVDSLIQKGLLSSSSLESLIHVAGEDYRTPWYQDYIVSQFDAKTGKSIMVGLVLTNKDSEIGQYYEGYNKFFSILNQKLNFTHKPRLVSIPKNVEPNFFRDQQGGNIDGLPGGLCILGDQQKKEFASNFCGDEKNLVYVYTSWLETSHLDEIFKVVKLPSAQNSCVINIYRASPEKAMSLMKQNPNLKFINYSSNNLSTLKKGHVLPNFCKEVGLDVQSCVVATNKEILDAIDQNSYFLKSQNLLERLLIKDTENVRERLKINNPNCRIEVIDVPNLFYQKRLAEVSEDVLSNGYFRSVFPSFTNSVTLNRGNKLNLIYSKPYNLAFNEYINVLHEQLGIALLEVDTWVNGHERDGNIHCMTSVQRRCKPQNIK